ncbi:MAG: DSD1 family PLP-dependent enzyme [Alphaproteobacteria bacterium]|nr:DSD1 family PLP-dependent enzyme [Alphaproteobacteria bacterium]
MNARAAVSASPLSSPNARLLGRPGGRAALDTPALVVDRAALDRNIAAMAAHVRAAGIALRPHVKTHKSVVIARRQVAAGALGVSCVTLGEAEIMVRANIPGVHVTSPATTAAKIARLVALARSPHRGLSAVVDHPDNVAALSVALRDAPAPLAVFVDVDAGQGRTGCTFDAAPKLAQVVRAAPGLAFAGIQAYAGHLQHVPARAERRERTLRLADRLRDLLQALARDGLPASVVTGGGTGTFDLDPEARIFTELQVGSYVFMDVEYRRALTDGRNALPFETALFVATAVVSVNQPDYVVTDAGLKSFATDGPPPEPARGAPPGSRYEFFGDEHGKLFVPVGATRPALGSVIECVTPHCDPTVNLHDLYHVVDRDTLVELWPVDARGKR